MRRVWLSASLAVTVTALVLGAWAAKNGVAERTTDQASREIVLIARTPTAKAGGDIRLWVAVHNRGPKPMLIDGRMMWPGNVFLWVKAPGSSDESGAETTRPRITRPVKADLVSLRSECFYGLEIVVGAHGDEHLVHELRKLRPGTYTFRAVYYSPDAPTLGAKGFEVSSNSVTVTVE